MFRVVCSLLHRMLRLVKAFQFTDEHGEVGGGLGFLCAAAITSDPFRLASTVVLRGLRSSTSPKHNPCNNTFDMHASHARKSFSPPHPPPPPPATTRPRCAGVPCQLDAGC